MKKIKNILRISGKNDQESLVNGDDYDNDTHNDEPKPSLTTKPTPTATPNHTQQSQQTHRQQPQQPLQPSQPRQQPQQPLQPSQPRQQQSQHTTDDTETREKISQLKLIFPDMDDLVIQLTLKDAGGSVERSVDALLNLQSIASTQKNSPKINPPTATAATTNTTNRPEPTYSPISAVPMSNKDQVPNGRIAPSRDQPSSSSQPVRKDSNASQHRGSLSEDTNNKEKKGVKKVVQNAIKNLTIGRPNQSDNNIENSGFNEHTTIDEQLVAAARNGNIQMIQHFMAEMKPYINRDIHGLLNQCLLLSIERGDLPLMRLLLDNGAYPDGVDTGGGCMSPLMLALESQQLPCAVALLKDYKADPNKSYTSLSPLHIATKYNYYDIVSLLVELGVHVNRVDPESGKTALHIAIQEGREYDLVAKLLQAGSDITYRDNTAGETPLHAAVRGCNNTQSVMLLCLLLDKAKEMGNIKLVNKQIKIVDIPSSTGDTILHLAIQKNHTYIIELLLRYSPDINIRNNNGKTPVDIAVAIGNQEVIEKLKNYGSNNKFPSPTTAHRSPPAIHAPAIQSAVQNSEDSDEEVLISRRKGNNNPLSLSTSSAQPNNNSKNTTTQSGGLSRSANIPININNNNNNNNNTNKPAPSSPRSPPPASSSSSPSSSSGPSSPRSAVPSHIASFSIRSKGPMDSDWKMVNDFKERIQSLFENNGFEEEFNHIETLTASANLTGDFCSALQPFNYRKNRYKNILPFEHTRVKLAAISEDLGSDYISASHVVGDVPNSDKQYICTQGPLQLTAADFWRMLLEYNTKVVVMLANEIENGKEKVFPYWPEQTALEFGYLRIECLEMKNNETHQIIQRKFLISNNQTNSSQEVTHFHYAGWPDQGLPESSEPLHHLVQEVDKINFPSHTADTPTDVNVPTPPPIVVHCSAGIGRSGVFCVVHSTLSKLNLLLSSSIKSALDIKACVLHMREQRAGMVQTQEQYKFCYLSLIDKLADILKILDYKNERWFHKSLDSKQTIQLLTNKPHGSFLFRSSSIPGFMVLSTVSGKDILHARVAVHHRGFELDNEVFPTLQELVATRKSVLIHPIFRSD